MEVFSTTHQSSSHPSLKHVQPKACALMHESQEGHWKRLGCSTVAADQTCTIVLEPSVTNNGHQTNNHYNVIMDVTLHHSQFILIK